MRLKLSDFETIGIWRWFRLSAPITDCLYLPRKCSWYSFLLEAESTHGYSAARRIMAITNSNDTIGNWTCDFWLVAKWLKQLCHRMPRHSIHDIFRTIIYTSLCLQVCNLVGDTNILFHLASRSNLDIEHGSSMFLSNFDNNSTHWEKPMYLAQTVSHILLPFGVSGWKINVINSVVYFYYYVWMYLMSIVCLITV
jgi:hypothetical protein